MSKQVRIVCLVTANEQGTAHCIDGEELTAILKQTFKCYGYTPSGIETMLQTILGNEPPPLGGQEDFPYDSVLAYLSHAKDQYAADQNLVDANVLSQAIKILDKPYSDE